MESKNIMKKNIKIFGIVATILLVMLSLSPALTASDSTDHVPEFTKTALTGFAQAYSQENTILVNYLEENEITEVDDVSHDIIEMIEQSQPEIRVIVEEYLSYYIQMQPLYDGHNAYWKSDTAVEFFADEDPPDYHDYWGHIFAFDKPLSDLISWTVLNLCPGMVYVLIGILWFILPGPIWLVVSEIIEELWGQFYAWFENVGQHSEYGIHMDFFKRDIWHPSPLLNRLELLTQKDEPWSPEDPDLYPESTWTAIIGPF